jgi:putative colanic acid biosynthesis glycosyltransferase
MPLFSIITITKNDPAGFARTRASIEAQTFSDYEWIVVDGSLPPDRFRNLPPSREWEGGLEGGRRCTYINEPDEGIYDAMNKGIQRACGDYLIFMNAGDTFAAFDVLARIAPLLNDADFAYGDALEGGHYKPAHHTIARGMVTHHQAMIFKKSARLYDLNYTIAADYKYTAQAIREAKNIVYLPFAICIFETGGVSQRRTKLGRQEQAAIRRELGLHTPLIGIVQFFSQLLKTYAPRVYWTIRSFRHCEAKPKQSRK